MSPKIVNILLVLVLIVLSLAIFANSMTKPLGRDEQMYCTAGVLLAQGKMIYKDFSYAAQMPYHPLLYAALFKILNTTHYLLAGRILSALCDILVMLCIVGIYRHIFNSYTISGALLGLAAAALYVFNPLVDYANGFAWNHDVVILCVVVSLWLFISADFKQKPKYCRTAVIAALLTLATCMRITTALVQLLFFAVLLTRPAESAKQRFKTALPFLIATVAVLIWPLWTVVLAPRAFFLNLCWIPILYGQWLHQMGLVHNKLDLIFSSITTPGYLALIVTAVYLCLIVIWQRRRLTITETRNLLPAIPLVVVFFIIALIPPTIWRQYLAMPVPFIIISLTFPLLYLRKLADNTGSNKHFNIASCLIAASVLVAVASHSVVLYRIPKLLDRQNWVPIRLHAVSADIAEKTESPKLILTLAPLFALEGGCDIYPQLSAGSIVYRIADLLSPADRDITHTVGPKTLKEMIHIAPPAAVILAVELEFLEAPLLQSAVKPNWQRQTYDNGPVVYFKR